MALTLHWNGAMWTSVPNTIPFGLLAVWGTSAGDVWAVGTFGGIARWNGTTWTVVLSGAASDILYGIWGSSANDVWAVGKEGALLHWEGSSWIGLSSGTGFDLTAIWGSSPTLAFAVGSSGVVLRWNGQGWATIAEASSPTSSRNLEAVWGSSGSNVLMVGSTSLRWNGLMLADFPLGDLPQPRAVWGSSAEDVWILKPPSRTISHWDGINVTEVALSADFVSLGALWGSSARDVWAVGAEGAIFHYQ